MTKPEDLDALMSTGTIVEVDAEGNASELRYDSGIYAPELLAFSDKNGQHLPDTDAHLKDDARSSGWELETGWTGQYGYSGPCMHQSEFVGGRLAEHVLETPGYWVAVEITEDDGESQCWALAHRDLEELQPLQG